METETKKRRKDVLRYTLNDKTVPLYDFNFSVVIMNATTKEASDMVIDKIFKESGVTENANSRVEYAGRVLCPENKCPLVVIRTVANKDTIAHESLHLAYIVCDKHGIALDIHNDEPVAYLVSYIFGQIEADYDSFIKQYGR